MMNPSNDRYTDWKRIGAGGQGTVYSAWDNHLNRTVALKVINEQDSNDPVYIRALQEEARLAATLDHENVTKVYDFQIKDGVASLVMEFVPHSLDNLLKKERILSWSKALQIALQVCRGLEHAHRRGVVHRDIKPANILLTKLKDGVAKVTDFGISKAMTSSLRIDTTTTVVGTFMYMPPEQWKGSNMDARLDQYALGIVIYEMITGKVPFDGPSQENYLYQHF